jgi:hypothetical protein
MACIVMRRQARQAVRRLDCARGCRGKPVVMAPRATPMVARFTR